VATEVEAVKARAAHRQAQPSGRLRVSMPSDVANLLLTERLAAFIALHPAGARELDGSPRRVDLLGENFDIAVRLGALPDDARLAARRIAVFPIGLYAAPTDLAEQGDPLSPEDRMHHEALRLIERDGEAAGWTLLSGPQRWEGRPAGRTTANSP
jgi:DNA-binding transcriptional LysR family regulator